MRSRAGLLVLAVLVLAREPVRAQGYTFEGIAWGSSRTDTEARIRALGFHPDTASTLPGGAFVSVINDLKTVLYAQYSRDGLVRLLMVFVTADEHAIPKYQRLVRSLTTASGPPDSVLNTFDPDRGAGLPERAALHAGSATLKSVWWSEGSYMYTEVTDNLVVLLIFEGPQWPAEAHRWTAPASRRRTRR